MVDASQGKRVLNFNIGVLGHVDSGKTSLAKALSTKASTASFDKNPQSLERGITLDLGFSSFQVPLPDHLKHEPYDVLQFTLVDCPGHASLIKTIIGGAQIIDMMMLVVDVTKGVQTQTAECLVIGEILCEKMVVVLNKVDLLKEDKREALAEKVTFVMIYIIVIYRITVYYKIPWKIPHIPGCVCACACACVRVCVYVCVCACVRACVRAWTGSRSEKSRGDVQSY